MKLNDNILAFLDLLDIHEDTIDLRINVITKKTNFTNEHLTSLIYLLQYKHIINQKENTECDNDEEYMFISKLITCVNEENVELVSTIINKILLLHPSSMTSKSEHLIQQLLADINLIPLNVHNENGNNNLQPNNTILNLKLCSSILNAIIELKYKISMAFLDAPLEYMVCNNSDQLRTYFLTNTVPKFFEAIEGYNILDRIWNYLKQLKNDQQENALKVLCFLSNYYLPIPNVCNNKIVQSNIISHTEFWDFILFGLTSENYSNRKQAVYLAKRAIDCLSRCKKSKNLFYHNTLLWDTSNMLAFKKMWDDYFILLDSLEEKQSNIVLPSLKLFNSIQSIGNCWLNCALNIGLRHDNNQVNAKCINYCLNQTTINRCETKLLLEAINEISFYENIDESSIKSRLALIDASTLINILRNIPQIKWSPIPLFYLTQAIGDVKIDMIDSTDEIEIVSIINDILKLPCNNIIIRKAIHVNISWLLGKIKRLQWQQYIILYPHLHIDKSFEVEKTSNPFHKILRELSLNNTEKKELLDVIKTSFAYIDFVILYFEGHETADFLQLINAMILNIQDISKRSYSNKIECFNDALFIAQLYHKLMKQGTSHVVFTLIGAKAFKPLLQYIQSLLSSDFVCGVEDILKFFEGVNSCVAYFVEDLYDLILQIHKSAILLLNDPNVCLDKKVLCVLALNATFKNQKILQLYRKSIGHEPVYKTVLHCVTLTCNENKNIEGNGRLKNAFYEKTCEIFFLLVDNANEIIICPEIFNFIDNMIESGGYGCLKWILKIINKYLPSILNDSLKKCNIIQMLNRLWNEIEELKSNKQYAICIEEFIKLITQDVLLNRSVYNNIVILYCMKIIECGVVKSLPIYYLSKQMQTKDFTKHSHLLYILCDMLLYSFAQRKEHRITENVVKAILEDSKYELCRQPDHYFDSHVRYLSVLALSNINESSSLNTIMQVMMKKVDELFKTKQRYHGNSQNHKIVLAAIQNLIFITLKSPQVDIEVTANWCMELLGKMPHQPFVRICLEWYIALYIYIKGIKFNEELLSIMQSKHISLNSQFMILYWIVAHEIQHSRCPKDLYEFVLDTLVSHTMGPTYSTRLYAQYLTVKLSEKADERGIDLNNYKSIIKVIRTTLANASNEKDKSFDKITQDYFVNTFDIIGDLTPYGIYYALPIISGDSDIEVADRNFINDVFNELNSKIETQIDYKFNEIWLECRKDFDHIKPEYIKKTCRFSMGEHDMDEEESGTIQKKYVPWKSMSDVDIYEEKQKSKSDLIVVASLIDRLPNLGGMARTSEVFGVRSYVVGSIRHMQDKQFQGLSVSAERWVNVEEVRPGQPLKDYLILKKSEGYTIVAAEQTSTSSRLQSFKFPKKSLLVLGNEKEGVPCDLLPLMDFCVEIPQQGVIRSLNVHVTAAIFIWEYARQNML